jgi:hypothetical protein
MDMECLNLWQQANRAVLFVIKGALSNVNIEQGSGCRVFSAGMKIVSMMFNR